ncbi:MAG: hypothetical protein JWL59_527 [Chthoniobacteraceae bacterium]|nr:hypothetical protein [Chthoniobacteraceae bacterium]
MKFFWALQRSHAEEKVNAERDLIVFVGKRLDVLPLSTKELLLDNWRRMALWSRGDDEASPSRPLDLFKRQPL